MIFELRIRKKDGDAKSQEEIFNGFLESIDLE